MNTSCKILNTYIKKVMKSGNNNLTKYMPYYFLYCELGDTCQLTIQFVYICCNDSSFDIIPVYV